VTDLTAKLNSAAQLIGSSISGLKLKSAPPGKGQPAQVEGKGNKGKVQAEYAGVEDEETPLSKAAKDRSALFCVFKSTLTAVVYESRQRRRMG